MYKLSIIKRGIMKNACGEEMEQLHLKTEDFLQSVFHNLANLS